MNIANVKLLFACDKNWNSMTACIDGRYCKFCDKRIIDLTTTSDEEIRKIYSISNGNVCGRFKASQIISAPSQRPNLFKQISVTFLLFFGINIYSKNLIAQITDNPDIIKIPAKDSTQEYFLGTIVEVMPSYKYGAEEGMINFIRENIIFPSDSVKGKVYVTFVVDKSGVVKDINLLRGLSIEADKEAIRLTNLLEFNPGMQNGKPVSVIYNLPISFTPSFYEELKNQNKRKNKKKNK